MTISIIKPTPRKFLRFIAALLFWTAVWQLISICVNSLLLVPGPADVFKALYVLTATSDFWKTLGMSLLRILAGYLLGIAAGICFAAVTAKWRIADILLSPLLRAARAVPVASFIILALLWIPSQQLPSFSVFLMVVPLAWENVREGIRRTDNRLLEMAQVFRLDSKTVIRRIRIPSVMPYFITACASGLGIAWKSGIAAEIIALPEFSIGRDLSVAKRYLETPEAFAWTIVIICASLLLEKLLLYMTKVLGRRYNI